MRMSIPTNWQRFLGPARAYSEPIAENHADLAASLQARYEEVFFRLLNRLYEKTKITNLCLAGGCALTASPTENLCQNPVREIYIQPAAYDGGGALGAAYML